MERTLFDLVRIHKNDTALVKAFLEDAGKSLERFRYFSKRPLTVIKNHLVTYLIMEGDLGPVCYGHLDQDQDSRIVWLGIAVREGHYNRGLGNIMMKSLICFARDNNIPEVFLSADNDNVNAIKLYSKFGFRLHTPGVNCSTYELDMSSVQLDVSETQQ